MYLFRRYFHSKFAKFYFLKHKEEKNRQEVSRIPYLSRDKLKYVYFKLIIFIKNRLHIKISFIRLSTVLINSKKWHLPSLDLLSDEYSTLHLLIAIIKRITSIVQRTKRCNSSYVAHARSLRKQSNVFVLFSERKVRKRSPLHSAVT